MLVEVIANVSSVEDVLGDDGRIIYIYCCCCCCCCCLRRGDRSLWYRLCVSVSVSSLNLELELLGDGYCCTSMVLAC